MPIIGKLRYVIDNTRFDAMAALGILSENGQNANDKQFNGLLNLTSYLYTTKGDALKLYAEKERDLELFAFSDASYNIGTAKSRLGGVFYLGYESGAFACFSKKDENKSNSTMEAELKTIERTARQIIIYRNLLESLATSNWSQQQFTQTVKQQWNCSSIIRIQRNWSTSWKQ